MGVSALIIAAIAASAVGAAGTLGAQALSNQSVDDTNAANANINVSNNAFNAEQAQIQRDWEKEMADTAVQRRIADLKAAGLNPMLAVGSGGASTPGAFAATSSGNAQMRAHDFSPLAQLSNNLGHLVTSAVQIKRLESLTHNDPQLMSNLSKVAGSVTNKITSASDMDALNQKYGDIVRDHSWLI